MSKRKTLKTGNKFFDFSILKLLQTYKNVASGTDLSSLHPNFPSGNSLRSHDATIRSQKSPSTQVYDLGTCSNVSDQAEDVLSLPRDAS